MQKEISMGFASTCSLMAFFLFFWGNFVHFAVAGDFCSSDFGKPIEERFVKSNMWDILTIKKLSDVNKCSVKRISAKNTACSFLIGGHHNDLYVLCKDNINNAYWFMNKNAFDEPPLKFGERQHDVARNQHLDARKSWVGPIDREGFLSPYQPASSGNDYPQTFTSVSEKKKIENPDFLIEMQSYNYLTVGGDARAAVAGSVSAECLYLRLVKWTAPGDLAAAETWMSAFLQDIRFETLDQPERLPENECRKPSVR